MARKGFIQVSPNLKGWIQTEQNLQKFGRIGNKRLHAALETAGYRVHEAVEPYTPIDTGDLRGSRFVSSRVEKTGNTVVVGFSAPHAATVHEKTEQKFVIGQAKFLERGWREASPQIVPWTVKALKGQLVRGAGLNRLRARDAKAYEIRHGDKLDSARKLISKAKSTISKTSKAPAKTRTSKPARRR